LANWSLIVQKKELGGLGAPDLRDLNLCLLASWIQRYHDSDGKLWKAIIDAKYHTKSPNIFCYPYREGSPFWKGIVWAAKAAKMSYKWKIGDERKVRFWEDQWFKTCSLSIQFWEVYSIVNEQGKTVREAWDGSNLKFTLRRTVDMRVWNQWLEVVQIASNLEIREEEDAII
jgi:hypothetical protein